VDERSWAISLPAATSDRSCSPSEKGHRATWVISLEGARPAHHPQTAHM